MVEGARTGMLESSHEYRIVGWLGRRHNPTCEDR
jgi:hypothetical protein